MSCDNVLSGPIGKWITVAVAIGLSNGCGQAGPKLYPVSGTVTFGGEPVTGATITLHSDHSPRLVTGRSDAQGRFQLSTFEEGDGAIAGEYIVTVTKYEVATPLATSPTSMDQAATSRTRVKVESSLPAQFSTPTTSPLRCTVSDDKPNEVPLRL